jgi:hypothetical protein
LFIALDNDVQIEIFISEGSHQLSEEGEQRFFYTPKDKVHPYLRVTNHGVAMESKQE